MPFALNVLTLRASEISEVTAFIIRTPPETDAGGHRAHARAARRAAPLQAAFGNFGIPDRLD